MMSTESNRGPSSRSSGPHRRPLVTVDSRTSPTCGASASCSGNCGLTAASHTQTCKIVKSSSKYPVGIACHDRLIVPRTSMKSWSTVGTRIQTSGPRSKRWPNFLTTTPKQPHKNSLLTCNSLSRRHNIKLSSIQTVCRMKLCHRAWQQQYVTVIIVDKEESIENQSNSNWALLLCITREQAALQIHEARDSIEWTPFVSRLHCVILLTAGSLIQDSDRLGLQRVQMMANPIKSIGLKREKKPEKKPIQVPGEFDWVANFLTTTAKVLRFTETTWGIISSQRAYGIACVFSIHINNRSIGSIECIHWESTSDNLKLCITMFDYWGSFAYQSHCVSVCRCHKSEACLLLWLPIGIHPSWPCHVIVMTITDLPCQGHSCCWLAHLNTVGGKIHHQFDTQAFSHSCNQSI